MLGYLARHAGERRLAGRDGGAARDAARLLGRRRRRRAAAGGSCGGMAAMSIVDAHHHVWDLAVRDQPWIAGPPMAPIRRSFTRRRPAAERAGGRGRRDRAGADRDGRGRDAGDARPRGGRPAGGGGGRLDRPDQPGDLRRAGPARRRPRRPSPGRHQAPGAVRAGPGLAAPPRRHPRPARRRRGRPVLRPRRAARISCAAATYAATEVPGLTLVLDHAGKPPIASGRARGVARGDPGVRRAAEHRLQAVRSGDRGAAGRTARARSSPVADVILEAFGARAGHVRLGLAGLPAGAATTPAWWQLARSLAAGLSDAERTRGVRRDRGPRCTGSADLAGRRRETRDRETGPWL